jgi:DUF1680 family protein
MSVANMDGKITSGFWAERLQMNAQSAIFHQWEMLEKTHCIDNFRIAAGIKEGFREGFFFADSDAYKWLDAASRILKHAPSPKLSDLVDEFIAILEAAQTEDGYLYTYNQIHFGNARWQCLQIEHEFYCLGHLIEAGVSHFEATGSERLLRIARNAADLLVSEFGEASPEFTDGHEEIEIALIKLSRATHAPQYRGLAQRLLERRGRISAYPLHFLAQAAHSAGRMTTVAAMRRQYYRGHPAAADFRLPEHNRHRVPALMPLRFAASAFSGKYTQQHLPLHQQEVPVGHAVRFAYLNTAAAMLARDIEANTDVPRMERLWQHMVQRRMSVSGGIGSLPLTEGFGRDYELDPEIVYNETCAALGSMLWSSELGLLTGDPCYDELFEWQLYNAASVGIGANGCSYFYNNPLTTEGGYQREPWYDIPCCPSNLSRVWASLGGQAVSVQENTITIHQYFGGFYNSDASLPVKMRMETKLPWHGNVSIALEMPSAQQLMLKFRKPAWAGDFALMLNGQPIQPGIEPSKPASVAACGLDFAQSAWLCLECVFSPGDRIDIVFDLPARLLHQDERIPGCGGQVAVSRGPILYCLEGICQPAGLEKLELASSKLRLNDAFPGYEGIPVLEDANGHTFTPYFLWGNRGDTPMTVFAPTLQR